MKMPEQFALGNYSQTVIMAAMMKDKEFPPANGRRTVLEFILPEWQRGFVWTQDQSVALIESIWRGIPIGTYSFVLKAGSPFDGYLVDGQQRMYALEQYVTNKFPVFGATYSELSSTDRRRFMMSHFPCYTIERDVDEKYLREYYNLLNFGGVNHTEQDRA